MNKFLEKIASSINRAGNLIFGGSTTKRIASAILAFTVAVSPISPALIIAADEIQQNETVEETTETSIEDEKTAVDVATESAIPDCLETVIEETVVDENDDFVVADPTETIDATAPPMEQVEDIDNQAEEETNIIIAESADEYYKLISSLPDGDQRVIVDTYEDLTSIEVSCGVYYDGTYILVFDDNDTYVNAVKHISDAGYEYAIDGSFSVCREFRFVFAYGNINPNASVKVAVIDTGSELANEKYSVIGDDVSDRDGHGTAMCSHILEETDNAYIISIKAIGDNGKGNMSDVYTAIQLAEDIGVDYILMAISIRNTGKYDAFVSLVEKTNATIVASAGNNGDDARDYIPAGISGVITVGALDSDGAINNTSNYGECVDYYVNADSTSEAASTALGIIIDNRTDELATGYSTDSNESGIRYKKIYEINDAGECFVVNDIGDDWIDVYGGGDGDCQISYSDFFTSGGYSTYALRDGENYSAEWCFYSHSIYCIQPFQETPRGGDDYERDSDNWDSVNNGLFQAALACAPGSDLYQLEIDWWRNNGQDVLRYSIPSDFSAECVDDGDYDTYNRMMYAIAHMAASYAYYFEDYDDLSIPSGDFRTAFEAYIAYLKEVRSNPTYTDWWAEVYECGYSSGGSSTNYQKVARGGATYSKVYLSIIKESDNPSVTDGNTCYSLEGTTYGLFSDSACNERVATFVVDANGTTTNEFACDIGAVYYLKEISAGRGYELDKKIYVVTVSSIGEISVSQNVISVLSGDVHHIVLKDIPGRDPLTINLRKIDKEGNVIHNASLNGAVFRVSYYAQDLGVSGNSDVTPTVIYNVQCNGNSTSIDLSYLKTLNPVGGSNPNYLKDLPADWDRYPYGTIRVQEITAPVGYRVNDQIIRYRLGTKIERYVESSSAYGNKSYWNQQQDGTWDLTELPEVGYYSLTKSLDDTKVRSDLAGFEYEIWNVSSSSSPVQIATGRSQTDGRVLWSYTIPDYYKNTDDSILLTGTTTYELELIATEQNEKGEEVAIQYQVREKKDSISIVYGNSKIPYSYAAPKTNSVSWNNATDYYYKTVTVSNEVVKREGVVNHYDFAGINVNKVVPSGNPFDVTKVKFKVYNTDNGKDTLIANGIVDGHGNVTWYRAHKDGYGIASTTSVNVLNYLPLGNYRVEETWDKDYLNVNSSISILIEEENNSGWNKIETKESYTYSYDLVLGTDKEVKDLSVENQTDVQKFNLSKVVSVAGDDSTITAQLYLLNGDKETLVATGTCTTTGIGTYGFKWDYSGKHVTENGLDTLVLPVGKYRVVELCPVTYYKSTKVPYTYKTPDGYASRTVNGKLQFYKDFELTKGTYATLESKINNVRIEGSFDIIKVERSGEGGSKSFDFEVYYRGNGNVASDNSVLIEIVSITTTDGKGRVALSKLPEGWYEIREVNADSSWISHWINSSTTSEGNKVVRLDSKDRKNTVLTIDDGIKEKGTSINAVVAYNDRTPKIKTVLVDKQTGDHITASSTSATLEDTVSYENILPGHYVMTGVLMDKNTGAEFLDKDGNKITGIAEFDVASELDEYGEAKLQSGTVVVTYIIDTAMIKNVTLVAFEELHSLSGTGTLVAEHKDINDENQTVHVPEIGTTAKDIENKTHTLTYKTNVTVLDTVTYENLIPGKTYSLEGTIYNTNTGEIYRDSKGNAYRKSVEFIATTASGTVDVIFKDVLVPYEKTKLVVFENLVLKEKGIVIAVHSDISDENQTVERPTAATSAMVGGNKDVWLKDGEVRNITITDTITYSGLEVGVLYRAEATLYKNDGTQLMLNGRPLTSIVLFRPENREGNVSVQITFSSEGFAEGEAVVVFEKVFDVATEDEVLLKEQTEDLLIARHEDLNDKDQTIIVHYHPPIPQTGESTSVSMIIGVIAILLGGCIGAVILIRKKKEE